MLQRLLPFLATGLVFGTLPLWIKAVGLYPYLGVEVMIWVIYALGFNLLLGTAGLPSFGHGAYFGVGAYAFGLTQLNFSSNLAACLGAAILAGAIASVVALTYRAGFGNDLVTFMVAHGVIELSCIFMAGGAGLLIGSAMIMPGDLSRGEALKTRGKEAVRLMMGVATLLVIAGLIEGFISPAPIDPRIKFSIAALTGIGLYSYLLLAGREEESPTSQVQSSMSAVS